jgi:4-amino-4-deoxy-L-arabinose transferase-like glycosyltransferase
MKLLAKIFYTIEVGSARSLVRLIPLAVVVLGIIAIYNIKVFNVKLYKGLNDMASMDNAQLARQLVRHQGFTTYLIRPYALTQVGAYEAKHGQTEMFPDSLYPSTAPRFIPDTYTAPGFPLVLAGFFKLLGTDFDEPLATMGKNGIFDGDHWIPLLNAGFILLTAGLMFLLGWRLFDERVAWMASVAFVIAQFVWNYSLMAVPINLLMLLITLLFFVATELHGMADKKFETDDVSNGWAWLIVPAMAVLLGLIGLNSLLLLILVLPFIVFLALMRRTNWSFPFIVLIIVGLMVAPWFYHWYRTCGNPLGSNLTLGMYGQGDYTGNQIYCATTIQVYNGLLSNFGAKQWIGFLWYFQHGWSLLGAHPMVLLFAVSFLHEFRRRRVQAFRWLVLACAFSIVFMTNLGDAQPSQLGAWNLVAILLPAMILIGTGFFFTLLDRMTTQLPLLTLTIVVATLALTIAPIALLFVTPNNSGYPFNYPPYMPPALSYITRLAPTDHWVTTDAPWATAWYGDHPSLWVPDSVSDFTNINDNICESAVILFTPLTTGKPATNLTTGEQKEWLPFVLGLSIPETFPLHRAGKFPGVPDYIIISNAGGAAR